MLSMTWILDNEGDLIMKWSIKDDGMCGASSYEATRVAKPGRLASISPMSRARPLRDTGPNPCLNRN